MRNAKIVCTLGPSSDDRATIRAMADAGMAVARLNASHGSTADRRRLLRAIRAVDAATDEPLASMLDLQGPEVRTRPLDDPVVLDAGSEIRFVDGAGDPPGRIGLTADVSAVDVGDRILLDDGRLETTVTAVEGGEVVVHVDAGGEIDGREGVNVPGVDLALEPVTESDRRELELAVEADADFVAASFVGDADDLYAVGEAIESFGGEIPVIAKVERADAVENLDGIVEAAYGVMVARGDLGVECPMEEVPVIQKRIIRRCREAGVPVITATEMLDSMIQARRPTRAEASDVANAVLDGSDAVMLSGETAIGDHPVRVVEAMDRIVREAEASEEYVELRESRVPTAEARTGALARSARYLARDIGASAVVAASESGYTALKTAKFRPGVPVVAATPDDGVRRRLALSGGVRPTGVTFADEGADAVIDEAVRAALAAGVAESGGTVVVLAGMMTELEGTRTTNTLKVHVAAETIAVGRGVVGGRATGPLVRSADGAIGAVPEGAILALGADFAERFEGDLSRLGGIVSARPGLTGYAAMVAREIGIPMISGAHVEESVPDRTVVTVDGERGVLYEGDMDPQ
ncbi:pyruvate kinase [Halovivax sp.]|uniref:pyruvate kinase n=1 Tax=Halovivax sp. TaxID=1935978 RepID=UPI0025BF12AF|nr:pyruvate kinase [Halovivax sp.]